MGGAVFIMLLVLHMCPTFTVGVESHQFFLTQFEKFRKPAPLPRWHHWCEVRACVQMVIIFRNDLTKFILFLRQTVCQTYTLYDENTLFLAAQCPSNEDYGLRTDFFSNNPCLSRSYSKNSKMLVYHTTHP